MAAECPNCGHSSAIHEDTESGWNCRSPGCGCPKTPEKIEQAAADDDDEGWMCCENPDLGYEHGETICGNCGTVIQQEQIYELAEEAIEQIDQTDKSSWSEAALEKWETTKKLWAILLQERENDGD